MVNVNWSKNFETMSLISIRKSMASERCSKMRTPLPLIKRIKFIEFSKTVPKNLAAVCVQRKIPSTKLPKVLKFYTHCEAAPR